MRPELIERAAERRLRERHFHRGRSGRSDANADLGPDPARPLGRPGARSGRQRDRSGGLQARRAQNITFAIRREFLRNSLEANRIELTASSDAATLENPEIPSRSAAVTVRVRCLREAASTGTSLQLRQKER